MRKLKGQALGIRVMLVLGMLLVMATASVDISASVSAHGGDASLVHLCVQSNGANVKVVHPLPAGNPDVDCVNPPWPFGAGWIPVDVGTIGGSGTLNFISKFTGAATIGDSGIFEDALGNVGIGTATPNEKLEITGNFRLPSTTATTGIIMADGNPFIHSFGTENFFAGESAGNLTMTGVNNTGLGANALQANTTGCCNAAVGDNSLTANTTGGFNTAVGSGALQDNTTGFANTAQGTNALGSNTSGFSNTASGSNALTNNTTGSMNTATGGSSLALNTIGTKNTATGRDALQSNTSGSNNTATGFEALLSNTSGFQNTAYGVKAMRSNTGGVNNTAFGLQALLDNATGGSNTGMGNLTLRRNTTGGSNTATGQNALENNTTGSFNTAVGKNALAGNKTGELNTAIGFDSGVFAGNSLTNTTAIGANAHVSVSNKIRLGDFNVTVIEGQVAFSSISDANLKENFPAVDGEETLEKISQMTVDSWNYKGHDPSQFRHYGPTAQEFFAAFGDDGFGTVGTETTINSGDMAGVMMIAIQALEKRNAALQQRNDDLEARLAAVEQAVGMTGAPAGIFPFGGLTMGLIFGGLLLVTPGLVLGYRRYMG